MINRALEPEIQEIRSFNIKKAETFILKNGTSVHTLVSGTQSIVKLELIFPAGNWFETLNGLSYISSKMLLEGTKLRSAREIADQIARYGAFIETHQGFENLNLTIYLMERQLDKILPIVMEILSISTFPESELENLKAITNQSIKVNAEKSQYLASVYFRKALFGDKHPYGTQYWEKDIEILRQEDVKTFSKEFIREEKCEIFVSGNFSIDNLIPKLDSFFQSKADKGSLLNLPPKTDPQNTTDLVLIERPEAVQSSLRLGCLTINRSHPDFIALLVVNEILGGFFGSRLMKNIREEKGFTYGIHSSIHSLMNSSYFVISTDVRKETTHETLLEIYKEIDFLKTILVTEDEIKTVTSYMAGRFMNSLTTSFALMDKFKSIYFARLSYDYYENYQKVLEAITPEQVKAVADKYLNVEQFSKVIVGGY